MVILKLKNINFNAINIQFYVGIVDVSNKISSGEKNYKYFVGYLYGDHKINLLHIMLPKTSKYVKSFDGQTKMMYFLIEDDELLEKYNTTSDKVSSVIKINF